MAKDNGCEGSKRHLLIVLDSNRYLTSFRLRGHGKGLGIRDQNHAGLGRVYHFHVWLLGSFQFHGTCISYKTVRLLVHHFRHLSKQHNSFSCNNCEKGLIKIQQSVKKGERAAT